MNNPPSKGAGEPYPLDSPPILLSRVRHSHFVSDARVTRDTSEGMGGIHGDTPCV